jgi:outer membrane protein assembly factor BamB
MARTRKTATRPAEIVREYGPYPGIDRVHGVTFDGTHVWFARGEGLVALEPGGGALVRELAVAADAGTAFDGEYLWQLAENRIQKVDPRSGLTWAEGTLWVGEYRARRIHQIDAGTGAVLRTIESDRFVTGVSWVNGELWHATMEGEQSDLRRIDPETGEVLERLEMPAGVAVTGLEADGDGVFYCGGGPSGTVRAVRPRSGPRRGPGTARRGDDRRDAMRRRPNKR